MLEMLKHVNAENKKEADIHGDRLLPLAEDLEEYYGFDEDDFLALYRDVMDEFLKGLPDEDREVWLKLIEAAVE